MNITVNERAILQGIFKSEYDGQSGMTWTFSAIEHSGLTGKVASGVLASLVKKGLVIIGGEYNNHDNESTIDITDLGRAYLKYTPTMKWDAKKKGFELIILDERGNGTRYDFSQVREIAQRWLEDTMKELAPVLAAQIKKEEEEASAKWNREHNNV